MRISTRIKTKRYDITRTNSLYYNLCYNRVFYEITGGEPYSLIFAQENLRGFVHITLFVEIFRWKNFRVKPGFAGNNVNNQIFEHGEFEK